MLVSHHETACADEQCKLDAIASYGALITQCAPGMDARESTCARVQQETGAVFIPPYNHPHIMAGQVRTRPLIACTCAPGQTCAYTPTQTPRLPQSCLLLMQEASALMGNSDICAYSN